MNIVFCNLNGLRFLFCYIYEMFRCNRGYEEKLFVVVVFGLN